MSLRSFLYATDAFMAEDGVRFAVKLGDTPDAPVPSPAENKARNADAMAQFQAMMGGLGKKRGRRR